MFAYAFNPNGDIDGLIQFINNGVDKAVVRSEIKGLFETYYSTEMHISNITSVLTECLK